MIGRIKLARRGKSQDEPQTFALLSPSLEDLAYGATRGLNFEKTYSFGGTEVGNQSPGFS